MTDSDAGWLQDLDDYAARFRDAFRRRDQARWAAVYLQGLLRHDGRKTIGGLARQVVLPPDLTVEDAAQRMQNFVNQSPWDEGRVWRLYRGLMAERLAETEGAFVLDDPAFVKQGRHSVGVQRQYSGALGRKTNCQIAIALHHAGSAGCCPLGLRLYLPRGWIQQPHRLDAAGVPEGRRRGQGKGAIALELLDEARVGGLAGRPCDGRRLLRDRPRIPCGACGAGMDVSAGRAGGRRVDGERNASSGGRRPCTGGQRRRGYGAGGVGPSGRGRGGGRADEGVRAGPFRGAVVARLPPSRLPGDAGVWISVFSGVEIEIRAVGAVGV